MERFKKTVITFAPALAIFLTILAIRFCPNSEPAQTNPNATPSPISTSQTNRNSPKPSVSTPQTEPGPPTPPSPSSQNEREKFFALLIGVDDYRNSCPALPDLRYACSDIMKIKDALVEKIGVPEANVLTLRACAEEKDPTKRPTRANIEASVRRLLEKSDADATILVVLTGHGFATKSGETAFAPEDVAFAKNGALDASTATSLVALAENLQTARAKSKALIVDACRTTVSTSGAPTQGTARGALKFEPTGLVTLQSCSARETSYEVASDDFCGGVFAHFLVEGIDKKRKKDASLSLIDVGGYASEKTAEYIRRRREAEAQSVEPSKRVFVTSQQPTCLMVAGADFYLSAPNWEAWYREGRALAWGLDGTKIDGRRALELLTKAAEAGSLEAQAELALLYYDGCEASPPNFHEAYKLAQEPAKSGNPFALKVLGDCYRYGAGVEQNVEEARRRYAEALKGLEALAETDDALALHQLALCYLGRLGTNKRDFKKMGEYCRRAVDLKCIKSYVTLGDMYCFGYGVERDYDKAIRLYNDAIEFNCGAAYEGLGDYYFSKSVDERDHRKAFDLFRQAAEKNDASGVTGLAFCYANGAGIEKDLEEGIRLYRQASEWNNGDATYMLANCYFRGVGVKEDRVKALELFRRAAELECLLAFNDVAACYENAWGTGRSEKYAKEWREREFQTYRTFAEADVSKAMVLLGECYYQGKGVEQDYGEAIRWFQKAAEADEEMAFCSLGICYYEGKGVEKNGDEAIKYFRRALEGGWRQATYWLGECYYEGVGVDPDYAEAIRFYQEATTFNVIEAMNRLGACYYCGDGVDKPDYDKAVFWFRKAADENNKWGLYWLGNCYYNAHGVERSYENAVDLYRRAADLGLADAMLMLGDCYYTGYGVEQDNLKAILYFREAAELNNAQACCALANVYLEGLTVRQNDEEAVKWLRKGAELNEPLAITLLGVCYFEGKGVQQDWNEATRLYRKAAEEMKYPKAMTLLGVCYAGGTGVEKDVDKALEWFRKAADLDDVNAMYNLGDLLCDEDDIEATRWLSKAADLGHARAMFIAGNRYAQGLGGERDLDKALKYWRKSAELEETHALFALGTAAVWKDIVKKAKTYNIELNVFEQGIVKLSPAFELLNGEIDVETGSAYLRKAVELDSKAAMWTLGMCHVFGVGIEQDLNEAQKFFAKAKTGNNEEIGNDMLAARLTEMVEEHWKQWRVVVDDDFEDLIDWGDETSENGERLEESIELNDETPEDGGDLDGVFDGGE